MHMFLDMTDNAWTMSIVSGAVGGVIILILIITSSVCFLHLRTKESIPQEMRLQMQPKYLILFLIDLLSLMIDDLLMKTTFCPFMVIIWQLIKTADWHTYD